MRRQMSRGSFLRGVGASAAAVGAAAMTGRSVYGAEPTNTQVTYKDVRTRGTIRIGMRPVNSGLVRVNGDPSQRPSFSGFEAEIAKAVALTLLGDANAWQPVPVYTGGQRFSFIRDGTVDMVLRSCTQNGARDGEEGEGVDFAPVYFADGQAVFVKSGHTLSGSSRVAVIGQTTSYNNILKYMQNTYGSYPAENLIVVNNTTELAAALGSSADAITSDFNAVNYIVASNSLSGGFVLDGEGNAKYISKEALAPVTSHDSAWRDVVSWTIWGMFALEEAAILEESSPGTLQSIINALNGRAEALGLQANWATLLWNNHMDYGSVWSRTLGAEGWDRGVNSSYLLGGIQYSPSF